MRWLWNRIADMLEPDEYQPPERVVLLWLAVLRAPVTGGSVLLLWHVQAAEGWSVAIRLLLLPCNAALFALVSADVIEHALRGILARLWPETFGAFGEGYNPWVSAIGEWEGWTGPTREGDAAAWQAVKCGPPAREAPWWGDTDSFCWKD